MNATKPGPSASVTNSGEYDGTGVYLYDSWKIIETRDGSGNLYQQFIHGTQYIDELVMMRVKDKGDLYVHQDANWNVVALSDLGGSVVERYIYTPYGQVTVHQETSYGDRDGDGDVDATDKGRQGSTCTGTVTGACRILDLDFDGDYDSADATLFDSLPQGLARHPGRVATAVHQPFAHQGLLHEAEIGSYQNRARQYDPGKRRFVQRDPIGQATGLNLYAYVKGTPLGANDPSGRILCHSQPPHGAASVICVDYNDDGTPGGAPTQEYWNRPENQRTGGETGCCVDQPSNGDPSVCRAYTCYPPTHDPDSCEGHCTELHEGVRHTQMNCAVSPPDCQCRPHYSAPHWQLDCDAYTIDCDCHWNSPQYGCNPFACDAVWNCCMMVATCGGLEDEAAAPICDAEVFGEGGPCEQ